MKLEKDDFGIWDNDDEELSIIKEGYKSKEIADYILSLQDELDRLLIKHDEVREELGNMKLTGTPRKHPYCLICEKMYMDFCMLHCSIPGSYEMRINND
jgi:hypothetical protein